MSGKGEDGTFPVSNQELLSFAKSLYSYFNCLYEIERIPTKTSKHFEEGIALAVLCIKVETTKYTTHILQTCGHGVGRWFLCWVICNKYPNDDYFKRLFFMSAFILEMIIWSHITFGSANPKMGSHLWKNIFLSFFKNEFRNHGGWNGLVKAAKEVVDQKSQIRKKFLPKSFLPTLTNVKELRRICEACIEPTEIGITSGFEMAHISDSEEEEEESQPSPKSPAPGENVNPLVQIFKEEIKENQPREVDDRPRANSPAPGGNVAEIENPLEGTSEKSRERDLTSHLLKRRHDDPVYEAVQASKSEEEREENWPGKAIKVEKSEEEIEENRPGEVDIPRASSPAIGGNVAEIENPLEGTSEKLGDSSDSRKPRKRVHDSPPQSDSATDAHLPSSSKMDRK